MGHCRLGQSRRQPEMTTSRTGPSMGHDAILLSPLLPHEAMHWVNTCHSRALKEMGTPTTVLCAMRKKELGPCLQSRLTPHTPVSPLCRQFVANVPSNHHLCSCGTPAFILVGHPSHHVSRLHQPACTSTAKETI